MSERLHHLGAMASLSVLALAMSGNVPEKANISQGKEINPRVGDSAALVEPEIGCGNPSNACSADQTCEYDYTKHNTVFKCVDNDIIPTQLIVPGTCKTDVLNKRDVCESDWIEPEKTTFINNYCGDVTKGGVPRTVLVQTYDGSEHNVVIDHSPCTIVAQIDAPSWNEGWEVYLGSNGQVSLEPSESAVAYLLPSTWSFGQVEDFLQKLKVGK